MSDQYEAVSQTAALQDFLGQLQPSATPEQAGPELPYELLRRGSGYEVRRYPAFTAARLASYTRRDEGYGVLGAACSQAMAPAILQIDNNGNQKSMMWPLTFCGPGDAEPPAPSLKDNASDEVQVVNLPSQVVAVGKYADASVEPVVRKAAAELQAACRRDGLGILDDDDVLRFCQYDAIFSMGQRRGEVWIPLKEHPWSTSASEE